MSVSTTIGLRHGSSLLQDSTDSLPAAAQVSTTPSVNPESSQSAGSGTPADSAGPKRIRHAQDRSREAPNPCSGRRPSTQGAGLQAKWLAVAVAIGAI